MEAVMAENVDIYYGNYKAVVELTFKLNEAETCS